MGGWSGRFLKTIETRDEPDESFQVEFENLEAELDEDDPLKIEPNGEDFLAAYKTAQDRVVKRVTTTSNDRRDDHGNGHTTRTM